MTLKGRSLLVPAVVFAGAAAAAGFDAAGAGLPPVFDVRHAAALPAPVLLASIAAATLVSEDLACLATGLLVAAGVVGFGAGTAACLLGILAGDLALVLAGRWVGAAAIGRAPLRYVVTAEDVRRGRDLLSRRGGAILLGARFVPGLRLPTYVAAGVCGMPLARFLGWFVLGAAAWTPLLVGAATLAGHGAIASFARWRGVAAPLAAGVLLLAASAAALPAAIARRRDAWRGLVRRWSRWEFWPLWFFYPPVVAVVAYEAVLRRRGTVFTAANPAIDAGGVVGESKSAILAGLAGAGARVAAWFVVPGAGAGDAAGRTRAVLDGMAAHGMTFPVVLKPDAGQRGLGVAICRDVEAVERCVAGRPAGGAAGEALIVQAYVPGVEFGLFYARHPDDARGRVISVTEKIMPEVVGDGVRTLERLVLDDDRAVALAGAYRLANAARWTDVPVPGERVRLVELGTHCRGAVFLDGARHLTPGLEHAVDAVARTFDGFWFGRFDVRAPSAEALRRGEFTVLELNGVTSEATHIYDPRHSVTYAWRTLVAQWRVAFDIGEANAARGAPVVGPLGLLRRALRFRSARRHG